MTVTVTFYELQRGEDTLAGTVSFDGSGFRVDPDTPLMRSVMDSMVQNPQSRALVTAQQNPTEWLYCLQFQFKSPYFRATAPVAA